MIQTAVLRIKERMEAGDWLAGTTIIQAKEYSGLDHSGSSRNGEKWLILDIF